MADVNGIVTILTPTPCIFSSLLEPRKFKGKGGKESGEAKFSATVMFTPDAVDYKAVKEKALEVARAKWPGRDIAADFKSGEFKLPWASGEKLIERRTKKLQKENKEYDGKYDFTKGHVLLKSGSQFAPVLSILQGSKWVDLEGPALAANKGKFYGGVKCLYELNLVAYDGVGEDGKDGVTAYLNKVGSTNVGDRLGGSRSSSAEAFAGYAGKPTQEDPTEKKGDLDDEIPF